MLTKEEQKRRAILKLNEIGSYKPYTNAFRKGTVTMYESFGGYFVDNDSELFKKISEVEEKYDGMVYAVIHNLTEFGELYTMLWQPSEAEDDEFCVHSHGDGTCGVFAYVLNVSDDSCSEFGTVGIKPALGGLLRVY